MAIAQTESLNTRIEMGSSMDEAISKDIEDANTRNEDPEKIKFITEEVQFPLRQRVMDMQQMIVVNQQGIMAIDG